MIALKTQADIAKMRRAGGVLAATMQAVREALRPGITTGELDSIGHESITRAGGVPSFLNYRGYPKATCISVNEVVVHGVPGGRVIQSGDIVGLDFGVCLDGYHADSAWTFPVGEISDEDARLLRVTEEALFVGLEKVRPGARMGDLSAAIQRHVESNGFSIVRDLVGHGIGRTLHEEPSVPNFGKAGTGVRFKEGMTLAVEPMVNAGTWRVVTLEDDWTIVTADGSRAAHFEHTIAVTRYGYEILTQL